MGQMHMLNGYSNIYWANVHILYQVYTFFDKSLSSQGLVGNEFKNCLNSLNWAARLEDDVFI